MLRQRLPLGPLKQNNAIDINKLTTTAVTETRTLVDYACTMRGPVHSAAAACVAALWTRAFVGATELQEKPQQLPETAGHKTEPVEGLSVLC